MSEWRKSKTPKTVYAGEDVKKGEHSTTDGLSATLHGQFRNQYGDPTGKWESV